MPTTTSNDELPGVLFLCVRNKGKSQMAAALARLRGKGVIRAYSAGTHPGDAINQASAESVAELGADMSGETPQGVTPELLGKVGLVVAIGGEVDTTALEEGGVPVQRWVTDEPSLRGIEGLERMRIIRDDIDARVRELVESYRSRGA